MSTARRLTGADKRQIEAAIANAKRQDKSRITSPCVNMPNIAWRRVLYALKDFLIKRLGSLLEHTT